MSPDANGEDGRDLWLWSDGSVTSTDEVWAYEQAFAEEARKRWSRRLRRWLTSPIGSKDGAT